ncbi:MAG TPA: response regulator [Rhodocyclaceae bacterium]|nr:response regulator [Rhodocyclaceae bacterium]
MIVYLVEPSALQSRMIVAALNAVGVRNIHRYATAAEALQRMHEAQPNVVISALYLPDMSGTDLIQILRRDAEFEHLPFILISSETRPQVLEPMRQSGACGILPKPFTEAQLRRALRSTLELLDDGGSDDSSGIDFESLRVLLVDDSAMARGFIRRVLETLGIAHFIEAENGVEAVLALADAMVDLVVTDYNMPEMDGKALIDHIRQKSWQTTVPILMVTSESDQGRLAAVEEAGVSGICDKPFEPGMVKNLLRKVLRPEFD